jgi:hypothetical protein
MNDSRHDKPLLPVEKTALEWENDARPRSTEAPAMGERHARWGYGYQDKVATARILDILRHELRTGVSSFEGVRLADIEAGRVDDFVLIWNTEVQGNSIKWSADATAINWGELIGANGLLKELAEGYLRLSKRWIDRRVTVRLQTNRSAATERHQSQLVTSFSVRDFIHDHWARGPRDDDTSTLSAVWEKIAGHVGLRGSGLADFTRRCEFVFNFPEPPSPGPDSRDMRAYQKQFDDLHKAIATWLTNYPEQDVIDRQSLLAAIGLPAHGTGLVQRFPQPQIPYERNGASARNIRILAASTNGGYLAVTGPAGIGKSTLVQDVLADYPFFIPYYAYLPDGEGNPRDRGEALTFFQDVNARLHKFFEFRLSLGIADIAQGREALREYMKKAHDLFVRERQKTILLIDGLDHVAREVGLQRSLLLELPRPDEVPDGFLIILSCQPQALQPDTIERHVSAAVAPVSGRDIVVEGLSRPEVHEIIQRIARQTDSAERDSLFDACQGNPLILTYLLKLLEASPRKTVGDAIAAAGSYVGDIDQYYRSALAVPLAAGETRHALALLSRAVPTIPMNWLQTWPERIRIENLYANVLAPFVRVEDESLFFIHNSLVAFLKDETRSKLPGADLEHDERTYHSTLADRCGHPPCAQPLGRAKVLHLLRAERDRELLEFLSSAWLREGIDAFLPHSELRPLVLYGLASAWKLGEYGEVIRLILLDYELDRRTARVDAPELARSFLNLDRPMIARSQVRTAGRILVDDKAALSFAGDLWRYGVDHDNRELEKLARIIYLQVKPVGFIYQGQPADRRQHPDLSDVLLEWAEAAPAFETGPEIVAQIGRLRFERSARPGEPSGANLKSRLLYRALQTALVNGWSIESCKAILSELTKLRQRIFIFAALIAICRKLPSARLLKRLSSIHGRLERDQDVDLKFGEALVEMGQLEQARVIISQIGHIRCGYFLNRHNLGFTDISYTITLSCLQQMLGLDEGTLPEVIDGKTEANGRIEATARLLGRLNAQVRNGMGVPDLRNTFRSILLFHNRQVVVPQYDRREEYSVSQAKLPIYRQLIRLANQLGRPGLEALRDELLELVRGPAGKQFLPPHRRIFAAALYRSRVLDRSGALALGLSTTADADDDDPAERQKACFDIAEFLHRIGAEDSVDEWILRASKVSAGAGSHKDYHMAQLAEWIDESIGSTVDAGKLLVLEKFARAIEVSGGAGSSAAATRILRSLFRVDPARTVSLGLEFIDRDVINISESLEAILIGGALEGASPALSISVYSELLCLIHPGNTSEAAVATVRSLGREKRVAGTHEVMESVRTNALPSHRVQVARALQDALRTDGLGEFSLIDGLKAGEDDSSRKNTLYKLQDGSLLTTDQVAARLSITGDKSQWNPNPSENSDFDWWRAIKKATIKDQDHWDALLEMFPPPGYRNVELLALKSQRLFDAGDIAAGRQAAEEAFKRARDGSWLEWFDGAQRRVAYGAMKRFDNDSAEQAARKNFGNDLSSGKLYMEGLLDEITDIFRFLNIQWPGAPVLQAVSDYLDGVLAANRKVPPVSSLQTLSIPQSPDAAICRFIVRFLAFPVVSVGAAARRALGRYGSQHGEGLVSLLAGAATWDSVQLEHLLACALSGLRENSSAFLDLRDRILVLNRHESLGVRGIAKRICARQGWPWKEINDVSRDQKVVVVSPRTSTDIKFREAQMLVGGDAALAWGTYPHIIDILENMGADRAELRSDFSRIYREVESTYLWADDTQFQRWMRLVLARFWLRKSAIIGREAVLRLLGITALSGDAPDGVESAYDYLLPVYDTRLELLRPVERPLELKAMEWDSNGEDRKRWLSGQGASEWSSYPKSSSGLHIIGERTYLIRPDWEWPREERYRGLLDAPVTPGLDRDSLAAARELTYESYLRGIGQSADQLVIWNPEHQLVGSVHQWVALSNRFGRALGWEPSSARPFEWLDASGALMVKSIFWRDGWIGLEPPRFEALGEGWLVLATDPGIASIRRNRPLAQTHMWIERHSHGDEPYKGSWHLAAPV